MSWGRRIVDRRSLLKAGSLGLVGLTGAVRAAPAAAPALSGFTHGVASGEPGPRSVLLWTRFAPPNGGDANLRVEISETEAFEAAQHRGTVMARQDRDHTAKLFIDNLSPDRWYFYRFVASDGTASPIGRTRTLPEGRTDDFRIAVFSCSDLPSGWFSAYAHAATRDDIDLVVHLGDYIYEYGLDIYRQYIAMMPGRSIQPETETIHLTDYRRRYANYRADPDLQALHQRFPMIAQWDDHEFADNAWKDGAVNHQPETEGEWSIRRRAAERAYREWMPVGDIPWASYQVGDLATLFRLETRITARSRQLDAAPLLDGPGDVGVALGALRDGPLQDPTRTLMGSAQEGWLSAGLKRSVDSGTRWQILAQQVVMGRVRTPGDMASLLPADASDALRRSVARNVAVANAGLPLTLDDWGGYPAARTRLLRSAVQADADLLVLSGDSHNAWAFNLTQDGTPAGVEFAGHSVTSPGIELAMPGASPDAIADAFVRANSELHWCDTSRRGYLTVTITPERATGDWLFLDTATRHVTSEPSTTRFHVDRRVRRIAKA